MTSVPTDNGRSTHTAGYVSRLLDTLDGEALVERSTRGRVESVDIKGCMRRWASSYDVLRSNGVVKALAPVGARQVLGRLGSLTGPTVVTGSFAAVRLAPVAGPALLMVYADDTAQIMDELDLIPTDDGANVVLLVPLDPIVWDGTTIEDKVTYAAPSQVANDCLTGNGRMPAEGEALLQWMLANEATWRKTKLTTSSDVAES